MALNLGWGPGFGNGFGGLLVKGCTRVMRDLLKGYIYA